MVAGRATCRRNVSWLVQLSAVLCMSALDPVQCNWRSGNDSHHWMHSLQLDANYQLFWSVNEQEVTFEVQVATLGYVIFGLSHNGQFQDADLVVGWVQNGRARFQVGSALLFFSLRRPLLSRSFVPSHSLWLSSACINRSAHVTLR